MSDIDQAYAAARLAQVDVSRETADRLVLFVDLLKRWNPSKNLVSAKTLDEVWVRHIADSLQLVVIAPEALRWVDLGSGGGLPALVIAAVMAGRPGAHVHCIESKLGKAAFLTEAARQMQVPVTVWPQRIEAVLSQQSLACDVVCARALAPLADLLSLANPLLKTGAIGIFPKGQDVVSELTDAAKYWKFEHQSIPSVTDPRAQILKVRDVLPASRSAHRH